MAFLASGMVLVSGGVWAVALLVTPDPLDPGSAALLAVSMVLGAATACLGLVLARGRWARWLALSVLGGQAALAIGLGVTAWTGVALATTVLGVFLVAGPWLDTFLRRLPPADPPAPTAVALALGLLFVPAVAALSAPGGVDPAHWAAGLAALATAWAFARALTAGLWSARLLVPALLVAAAVSSPVGGLITLVAAALGIATLAWIPATALAVNPLVPTASGVAVPPELVPADLLARAGYDERGRPVKRPRS